MRTKHFGRTGWAPRTQSTRGGNAAAAELPPLSVEVMARVKAIYEARIKPHVHQRW